MPYGMVERHILERPLNQLQLLDSPITGDMMPMVSTYRANMPPGPAGRWFVEQLKISAATETAGTAPASMTWQISGTADGGARQRAIAN